MALERFIPKSPDPFIRNSQDFEVAKFGHLNTIIEYINSYVVTDSLQLAGSGPITSTARYITDTTGVNSAISISTIRVGIGTNTPSSELHIDGHSGFGASLKITTNKVNSVAYVQMISDYVTGFEQYQYGGPGWGWPNWTTNRSGGTAAAPTTAPNNYGLNEYAIWSYDGTGNGQGYAMITRTSETWTSTAHGIYTTFSTVATGSTSLVERMRFSANGNITFNNASDIAKVSIKGSGSTLATNSLHIQNSAGTTQLYMRDDGVMVFSNQVQGPLLRASSNLACSNFQTQNYAGLWMSVDDLVNVGNVTIGNGTTTLGARVGIKGSGSTSATTSLLVQNSAGTSALTIRDDGNTSIGAAGINARLNFINTNGSGAAYIAGSGNGGVVEFNSSSGAGIRFSDGYGNTNMFVAGLPTPSVSMGKTTAAVASALLEMESTTKGFLPPRMTTAQRVAIASPVNGLIVFDTDVQNLCYRRDGVWVQATFAAV
jgi:hypothetical protein